MEEEIDSTDIEVNIGLDNKQSLKTPLVNK